jgi:nucleoside-diphosphate-sugar epimerase
MSRNVLPVSTWSMKILVVGSRGFIGSHLTKALRCSGFEVLELSSSTPGGLDPVTGLFPPEMTLPDELEAIVYLSQSPFNAQLPDNVCHLFAVNFLSPLKLAQMACTKRVRRFIYASTGSVYAPGFKAFPEPAPLRRNDWYALSKIHAEEALALLRDRIDVTAVRLFGVYGPGQRDRLMPGLVQSVRSGNPVVIERNPHDRHDDGGLKISLTYVDDAANILAALCTVEGPPILNVAGDEALSIRQIATSIGKRIGRDPVFQFSPEARSTDLIADVSLLQRTLRPSFTSFTDGLQRTLGPVAP